MIRSFADRETARFFLGEEVPKFRAIAAVAKRKLDQLNAAGRVEDLRSPPGNRLEKLKGDRIGQWSIRVNERYRICFEWKGGHAENVEITDYH